MKTQLRKFVMGCELFLCSFISIDSYAAQVVARVYVTPDANLADVRSALISKGAVVKDFLPEGAFAVTVEDSTLESLGGLPAVLKVEVIAAPSTGGVPPLPTAWREPTFGLTIPPAEEEELLDQQAGVKTTIQITPSKLAEQRVKAGYAALSRLKALNAPILPESVDNSLSKYFPPIGDQEGRSSCAAWAACYYWSTYTQARDENKDVSGRWEPRDPPCDILTNGKYDPVKGAACFAKLNDQKNPPQPSRARESIASPAFLYPLINHGADQGTYFTMGEVMTFLNNVGCSSWASKPYDPWLFNDVSIDWPTEAQWIDALSRRTTETRQVNLSNPGQLDVLKQLLANGDIAITRGNFKGNWSNFWNPSCQNDGTCPGINNDVLFEAGNLPCNPDPNHYADSCGHAVTVVGYNDNKEYIGSDGNIHRGALLIANSASSYFGTFNSTGSTAHPGPDPNSRGFIWIAYEYAMTSGNWNLMVYNTDRPNYRPRLYAASGLSAVDRLDLSLSGGTGLTTNPLFLSQLTLDNNRWQNIWYGVANSIDPDRRVVVDLTDGLSNFVPRSPVFVKLDVSSSASSGSEIQTSQFFHDFDGNGIFGVATSLDPPVFVGVAATGYATTLLDIGIPLIGDKDDFHPGDVADKPIRSQRVQDLIYWIGANPDQDPGVDLDDGKGVGFGYNRPVGFTHYVSLPAGAKITAAAIKFRAKASQGSDSFYNDGIIYEPLDSLPPAKQSVAQQSSYSKSFKDDPKCAVPADYNPADQADQDKQINLSECQREDFYPYITLRDLLGYEPYDNETYLFTINLGKVPLRTARLPGFRFGDHWSAAIDAHRDLLGFLSDGQFDMIIGDDSQVDYSMLEVIYVLPGAPTGDLTGDGKIDINDARLLDAATGTNTYGADDPRDLNLPKDGMITKQDVRKLISLCTNAGCAP